jgi:TolB-like protein
MSGRAVVLALTLFAAALGIVALLGRPRILLRVQAPAEKPELAVLPFRNLSGEPELEMVSADLTAAVAEAVAETGRASIVSREKILGFALDREGIEGVARALDADYVIAGSLNENDGRIEVDAYLFRAGPSPALWADRLSFEPSERSSIASDLAARIREAILSAR